MKKVISFILAFIMIVGAVASAAPGDIIHTGTKKVYGKDDLKQLAADILEGSKSDNSYVNKFYREVESDDNNNRKFVNIVEEEEKELELLLAVIQKENIKSSEDLKKYLADPKNQNVLGDIAKEVASIEKKTIDTIPGGGSLDDYFGDSKAPKLKAGENYSTPVPGSTDGTSQIINLTLPKGSNSWVYKLGAAEDFLDLQVDQVVTGTTEYKSGRNIAVEEGQYLFLGALDVSGKLKAYASIEILEGMIRKPKVELDKEDPSINAEIKKSKNYSGATTVEITSSPGEGTWKLAILNDKPEKVYKHINHNNFNGVEYDEDNIEHPVASDSELDKGLDEFKKYIIVYSEVDGEIHKYRIFDLDVNNISGIFKAEALISEEVNPTDYNYSTPVPGSSAGTTKIVTLKLPTGATQWVYAIVESGVEPNRDRVYKDSKPYNQGEDIEVKPEDNLMILATDDAGKVRAYGIVEEVKAGMIKNPLATELRETTHYKNPVKGHAVGHTKFAFLKYDGIDSWLYEISENDMDSPELDAIISGSSLALTDNIPDEISIESDHSKLKSDNFGRYMMIYGVDDDSKIKVFKKFIMDDTNVRMPNSTILTQSTHYSEPIKGSLPNTTKITTLTHTGLVSTKYRYKVVESSSIVEIEFNEIIDGSKDFTTTTNIPTTVGKDLLILATDKDNKTKGYKIVPLEFNNVLAGSATPLQPTTNYLGPVPGDDNNTTKFTFLSPRDSMYYAISDSRFGTIESGTSITVGTETDSYTKATVNTDISATVGQYLLLVSVDSNNKIIGAKEFQLNDNHIKGGEVNELDKQAYSFVMGDNPSTTKLKLEPVALDNPYSIVWRYKLVDSEPTDPKEKPYFNQVFNDSNSIRYNVNSSTKIGPDIKVTKIDNNYGWILLLATDSSGRTKGYKYLNIDDTENVKYVKEHAPEIEASTGVELKYIDGTVVDSINFDSLPELTTGNSYKYLISNTSPTTPAKGDSLPRGIVEYDKGSDSKYPDIVIQLGKYLSLYEVNKDNKIVAYKTFVIDKVKQGKAELSNDTILEGQIRSGGSSFTVTLNEGTTWSDLSVKVNRDKLFNGFKADNEASEWSKVVSSLMSDGVGSMSVDTANKKLTVMIPETLGYDISQEQKIKLIVPPEAINGAINPINATGNLTIKPTIGATISGDVVNSIVRQSDIEKGGKTIVVELEDATWAGDVSSIIKLFNSSGDNWSRIAGKVESDGKIVRNSGTKVTVTLPPVPGLNFGTKSEIISLTIPKGHSSVDTEEDIIAGPNFTLYPDIIKVEGNVKDSVKVKVLAPDYKIIDSSSNTWTIENINGTLVSDLNNNHIVLNMLPRGLSYEVKRISDTSFKIEINGTASAKIAENTIVKLKIKGSIISEPNSVDSDDIELGFENLGAMTELNGVGLDVLNNLLTNTTINMEYSLNSTNGTTTGTWEVATAGTTNVGEFKAGKVYVRNKNNYSEYRLIKTLPTIPKPTGIKIDEVIYDDDKKMNIKLNIEDNLYQYRINGNDWNDYDSANSIELNFSGTAPELRVRLRATTDDLASLPSNRVDILYLGNVSKDVSAGEIKNTTTNMQYSIDNKANYQTARSGKTTGINFIASKVFIRDKNNINNERSLVEVKNEDPPITDDVKYFIEMGTMTYSGTGGTESLQYKVGDDPWKDVKDGKNIEFKVGELLFRTKSTKDNLPSSSIKKTDIATAVSAPELRVNDVKKTIEYRYDNQWKDIKETSLDLQFKIGNGAWTDGTEWEPTNIEHKNVSVQVRIKATKTTLPGQLATVSFSKNLSFANVELNVVEGYIENTTSEMQFSINSTEGLNGTWHNCSNSRTIVEFKEGMIIHLRETKKPANNHKLNTAEIEAEVKPDESQITYNILEGSIANGITKYIEYRFGNGKWTVIPMADSNDRPTTIHGIEFKPGILEFRTRGTKERLPSSSISITIATNASVPALTYDDIKFTIDNIDAKDNTAPLYEYSINGGLWTDGTVNTQFEGGNKVKVRFKATESKLPSQEQEITFTASLYLGNVILNAGKLQLANTTTDMEYSFDSLDWFKCNKDTTKINLKKDMKIYIREIKKPKNQKPVNKTATEQKENTTLKNSISNITYDIVARTIVINPNITEELQYRVGVGNGSWINIDDSKAENVNFVAGRLEFRIRGDETHLPSEPILKDTIQAPASAPNVTKGFTNDRNIVIYKDNTKDTLKELEYSFYENGPWINGSNLTTEVLDKDIYIRTKATAPALASAIKKLDFKSVLNLKVINLSTHVDPHELNGTTNKMEYKIYLIGGTDTGWITCDNGNTIMPTWLKTSINDTLSFEKLEIRDANQHGNIVIIQP